MQERHRFTFFGRPRGPWRASREEALQDAMNVGEAFRDRFDNGRIYQAPGVRIVTERRIG